MTFIRFSHPQYLLLLPLVWAFTWWVLRDSLADLGRARGRLSAAIRAGVLTLLVLALAGAQLVRPTRTLCTAFVVDVSDSISPAQRETVLNYIRKATRQMRGGDQAALVAFGADALLDHAPEDREGIRNIVSLPGTARTDIAAGIQLAMASFPQESGKQVVIFSDGNENLGNAVEQASQAVSSDVRISVVPLARDTSHGEALLLRADVPAEVKQGAPFQVSVVAESLQETDGVVTLYRNKQPVEKKSVHLTPGKKVVSFEQSVAESGLYNYSAVLDVPAGQDTVPDNNIAYAYTRISGKPTVLIVEGTPGDAAPLARALRANDLQVLVGGPDRIPTSLAECAQYDSVVFANVPAWRMSPTQMTIIRSAVRDTGMGFAMIGGEESFGAGGYYKTPIEEALPVTMDIKKQKVLPSITLVIVIDISGSMGAEEDGVPKIRLAAAAAKAAVDLLQPIDQVCVIGYDTPDAFTYTVKMTSAGNKPAIYSQIDRLQPGGGGIYGYSALQEAHKAIQGSPSQIKHIIFCADAADDDEPGDSVNLARQMLRNEKISLSVVGFGTMHDKDWPLYQDMAKAGGGTAYLAERLSNLPQIFTRDVLAASKPLLIEEPFRVRPLDTAHPASRGIPWAGAPPLLGYVATSMKAMPALELLGSPKDDPVLAAWPYGLGRSVAFTSDAAAHWGVHWLGWGNYPAFWAQTLRWTLRHSGKANLNTTVTEEHGRATVAVEAVTPEGDFVNQLDLRAHVAQVSPSGVDGPRSSEQEIPLEQTAPGRYEASFEALRANTTYVVTVEQRGEDGTPQGMQMATMSIPYSPEFQSVRPNLPLLTQLAERGHGVLSPKPADIYGRLRFGSRVMRDLWPLLLLLLSILFLFDVAVRRILLPWTELFQLAWQAIAGRLPAWKTAGPAPASPQQSKLGTLLGAKERVRQPRADQSTAASLRAMREDARAQQPGPIAPPPPPAEQPAAPPPEPVVSSTAGRLLQKKRERQGG